MTRVQQACFPVLLAALAGGLRAARAAASRRPFHRALTALALAAGLLFTAGPDPQLLAGSVRSRLAGAPAWQPVNNFLARRWTPNFRVEVAATYGHWESTGSAAATHWPGAGTDKPTSPVTARSSDP